MALLTAGLLAACEPAPVAPLSVGTNVWLGYEPLYLARSLGKFDKQHIKLIEYTSTTDVLRAFRNKTLDAAAVTLDEALGLAQDGIPFKVVLVLDVSNGADAIVAQPEVDSLQAMRGKRLGAETTALGAYMTKRMLDHAGLKPDEITVVPLNIDEAEQAFNKHRVDAVQCFSPYKEQLVDAGGKVIFDSSEIPGEIVDVLIVREDMMDEHRRQLGALVHAWFETLGYIAQHPKDAIRRMQPRQKMPPAEMKAALQGLRWPDAAGNLAMLAGPTPTLQRTLSRLADVMLSSHLLRHKPDVQGRLDTTLIRADK